MPLLTIFTAPKPFTNPHIATIQWNAIQSWLALGPDVEVVVIGDEPGLAEAAAQLGVKYLPQVQRNSSGTPLISSIFELGRQAGDSPLLAYLNADIITLPDFLSTARQLLLLAPKFLAVGQRWDLDVTERLDFSGEGRQRLEADLNQRGKLHKPSGSDYFLYPRACFEHIPDFAVGRAGWDNWMFYEARRQHWPLVDATASIRIIHQNHDYSHLPNGQPHYKLPETFENIRLAGGRRTIFKLLDTNYRLVGRQMQRPVLTRKKFLREVEIFPLVTLHSYALGQAAFALLHPQKAYGELRSWLRQRKEQK